MKIEKFENDETDPEILLMQGLLLGHKKSN